mmetsp:Transcript_155174/g.496165  ORF Transcript_155174/g.496165 Transcript_155174/m.496165 type:complete len:227 (-) Transcript_155174:745-1425(-)
MAEIFRASLRLQLAGLLEGVVDFQRVEDGLVHVEVLVRRQPTNEANLGLLLGEEPVALIQLLILRVRHRVIGFADIRRGLLGDEGALDLAFLHGLRLVGHVLVLDDAREGDVRRGVIDDHGLLVEALVGLLDVGLLEVQGAVLQLRHASLREVRVDRAGVHKHLVLGQAAGLPLGEVVDIHPHGDVGIPQEHVLKDTCVPAHRERLKGVAKVPLIGVCAAGQSQQH